MTDDHLWGFKSSLGQPAPYQAISSRSQRCTPLGNHREQEGSRAGGGGGGVWSERTSGRVRSHREQPCPGPVGAAAHQVEDMQGTQECLNKNLLNTLDSCLSLTPSLSTLTIRRSCQLYLQTVFRTCLPLSVAPPLPPWSGHPRASTCTDTTTASWTPWSALSSGWNQFL